MEKVCFATNTSNPVTIWRIHCSLINTESLYPDKSDKLLFLEFREYLQEVNHVGVCFGQVLVLSCS